MMPTFENVLSQAKNLTFAEKTKLIEMLTDEKFTPRKNHLSQKDAKILAELKKIIDERERNPNLQIAKSSKIAEDIRRKNERGYWL